MGGSDAAGAADVAGSGGSNSAGMGGGAGSSGSSGTAGTGGGSTSPGHLTLSATELDFYVECPGPTVATPQTLTLTNTGGTALTWSATFDSSKALSSSGSTLAPGAHVDVAVSPPPITTSMPAQSSVDLGSLTIASDVPGQAAQAVTLYEGASGYFATPDADLNFGDVFIGDVGGGTVPPVGSVPGLVLSSSNPDFVLSGATPSQQLTWSLTFTPTKSGVDTTTLTIGSFSSCVWPPNTFKATGTGVYDSTCTHLGEGEPCAADATCEADGCTLLVNFLGGQVNATASVQFSDNVASFSIDSAPGVSESVRCPRSPRRSTGATARAPQASFRAAPRPLSSPAAMSTPARLT